MDSAGFSVRNELIPCDGMFHIALSWLQLSLIEHQLFIHSVTLQYLFNPHTGLSRRGGWGSERCLTKPQFGLLVWLILCSQYLEPIHIVTDSIQRKWGLKLGLASWNGRLLFIHKGNGFKPCRSYLKQIMFLWYRRVNRTFLYEHAHPHFFPVAWNKLRYVCPLGLSCMLTKKHALSPFFVLLSWCLLVHGGNGAY